MTDINDHVEYYRCYSIVDIWSFTQSLIFALSLENVAHHLAHPVVIIIAFPQ